MNSVRVLYVARGGAIAGSQRQLLNLLKRIDRTVYEPLVVCSEGGDLADKLAEMGIETLVHRQFFGWRTTRHLIHRYIFRAALLRQLAGRKIGLIHCSYPWYSPYCLYLAKRLGCPCVIHIRGPVDRAMVRKNGFARADGLIAISTRSRRDIIEAGVCPEKTHLIYDSIDTEVFRPLPHARERFNSNGDFVFGLVGRIEPAKYQMEFVHAAGRVAARHKNVKFVLAGHAWNRAYAEKIEHYIKNAGLSDRIALYGRREEMPDVLSSFDVLVSLSGGSVMYEAMACGVPVLSAGYTRKEDSVHVVHDYNAMLVESREPDSLARAMERILEDSRYLHTLAENTRPHVLSHLTDSVMAERTEAVYQTLLGRRETDLPCDY